MRKLLIVAIFALATAGMTGPAAAQSAPAAAPTLTAVFDGMLGGNPHWGYFNRNRASAVAVESDLTAIVGAQVGARTAGFVCGSAVSTLPGYTPGSSAPTAVESAAVTATATGFDAVVTVNPAACAPAVTAAAGVENANARLAYAPAEEALRLFGKAINGQIAGTAAVAGTNVTVNITVTDLTATAPATPAAGAP